MGNYVRRRGVTLTPQGSRKLHQAKAQVEIEQNFKRYTLEVFSEKTGLTPTTISKVFTGSTAVDKRTLKCCFDVLNLKLSTEDYSYVKPEPENMTEISSMSFADNCCDLKLIDKYPNTLQNQSMPQPPDHPSIPGGHLPPDSIFYIDRPILESLCYQAIGQPGAMVNICAAKQMGKTSLMTRILAYAKAQGDRTVFLNLQLADSKILGNLKCFLQWFCARLSKQLDLPDQTADFEHDSWGSKSNATDYLENVILANCDRPASSRNNCPLVIAIDEINQLFAYPDIAREFLLLLRTWSEKAKERVLENNLWQKLRLVTVNSTEILLPLSINPSLLNTALVINLPEFTLAQVQDLANRYGEELTEQQIEQLMTLVGGHPYRLQLAFYHLQQQTITLQELLTNSEITLAIYGEHLQQQWWNLRRHPELVPIFAQIVSNPNPVEIELYPSSQLEKMGLIHLEGERASLACELFRPFFSDRLSQPSS